MVEEQFEQDSEEDDFDPNELDAKYEKDELWWDHHNELVCNHNYPFPSWRPKIAWCQTE